MDKYFFWCSSSRKEKKNKVGIFFFMYLPVVGRNEKKCILMFLGIFPIACVRKKNVYMYFWAFSSSWK